MSKADRPTKLYFKGEYDATGQPLEWFGGVPSEYDPIPARDLGPDDTALLTEAQWKVLESESGKRLYQKTEPAAHAPEASAPLSAEDKPSSNTRSQHGDTSARTAGD
jgi:hypothetical protein